MLSCERSLPDVPRPSIGDLVNSHTTPTKPRPVSSLAAHDTFRSTGSLDSGFPMRQRIGPRRFEISIALQTKDLGPYRLRVISGLGGGL